ncbi:MAG: xanthine dehydrogenase family protein molybdopterin-binding subunit, partial [Acidimicrobiia bacterium]|nr:xanthine dehydrogenase family protein molybdopterin-binding subunit [Acidimicrobiia bacterium]
MVVTEARKFIRADGPDKVTGSGRYVADISLTGMAVAKFKYAGIAHARITRLDVAKARAIPGVFAVLTQDDVPNVRFGAIPDRTLFASDVVRFEGEVVAAVAAIDTRTASEALDAIEVEYEPLPIVDDLELALDDESPLVHSGWSEYDADHVERNRNVASFSSIARGDVVAGFDEADVVITSAFEADASHAVPIEPRGILAQWEGENVTIWSATQVPFQARAGVCETLGLATNKVRVIVPHLGGGFGGKCGFHFEAHVAALARAAGRPVKLVFTREEEFVAPDRRREGMTIEVTTGLRNDGTLVARRGRLLLDNGAYTADADFFPQLAAMHLAGPYKVPNVLIEASLIYTNRQPSGSVRAPTAPQACWALESHTDELAAAVGMDPVDFRRLNAIDSGAVGVVGQTYGEIGLQACIEAAVDTIGYGSVVANDEAIGVAIGWWPSFPGPSGIYIKIDDDGAGQIITGAQECGTGAVMTLPGLVAGELGMRPEDFDLVYQDTSAAPYDVGATGSQTLLNNGRAALSGARELGRQLKELAAEHLEASAEDIILANGEASVAGSPTSSVSIVQLAAIAADNNLLLAHGSSEVLEDPPLVGSTCVGDQGVAAWSAPQFSCHAVRVRL